MELETYRHVTGQFVILRPVEISDAELIYEWRTGPAGKYLNQPLNYSVESQRQWIKSRPAAELNYIICKKDTGEAVGMISIVDIDTQNRKAEVGRLLLGEKYLNESNPFGLEAMKITYDIVLNKWDFNKIHGTILALNEGMVKLQQFLGMEQEGILRRHLYLLDQYVDVYLFSIFKKELNAKYLHRINFLLKPFKTN